MSAVGRRHSRPQLLLPRPIAAERIYTRALVLGNRKLVIDTQKGSEEIYDLAKDPEEAKNLFDELGEHGQDEIEILRSFFAAHERASR